MWYWRKLVGLGLLLGPLGVESCDKLVSDTAATPRGRPTPRVVGLPPRSGRLSKEAQLLHYAFHGNLRGVQGLITGGVNVNYHSPGDEHDTALFRAARFLNTPVVHALIAAGAGAEHFERTLRRAQDCAVGFQIAKLADASVIKPEVVAVETARVQQEVAAIFAGYRNYYQSCRAPYLPSEAGRSDTDSGLGSDSTAVSDCSPEI